MSYYAVANGRTNGILSSWNDCSESVKGFKNAIYKKFKTREEAEIFIQDYQSLVNNNNNTTTIGNEIDKTIDFITDYYVYTDGACSNNGKENAMAGIGVFFGENNTRNISKRVEGKQTNNTAELVAIIETYRLIENDIIEGKNITIVTDSEYAMKCVSTYGKKCQDNNWKKEIPNKELVKTVYGLYNQKTNIRFMYIKAHTGDTDIHSIGNYQADKLANMAIGLDVCPYHK